MKNEKIYGNLAYFLKEKTHVDICLTASKKAGNARWKLLAYHSFYYIQTMQNGEVDSSNFLWNKKVGNAHSKLLAYRSFSCIQTMQNGEVDLSNFLWYKKI